MELLEEYLKRHEIKEPVVRYSDKSQLLLSSKSDKAIHRWLHIEIDLRQEPNKPPYFNFRVAANPTIYTTPDFSYSSCHHEKVLSEQGWDWDSFELNIKEWCKDHSRSYHAINLKDAIPICWKMFVVNNDRWLANHLPIRMIDDLHGSLFSAKAPDFIMKIEEWLRDRHERAYSSWLMVRKNFDTNYYADWLADMVNFNTK